MTRTSRKATLTAGQYALLATAICLGQHSAQAASYSTSTFATGAAVSATAADSVTYGGGSVWVEFSNGASSSSYTGNSTIVQYSTSGAVQNTYTLGGNVDGLKYNPNTGMVWALQNQDGNSQISVINPTTKAVSTYNYGSAYAPVSGSRGFDDVAFIGSNAYLSFTNPAGTSDAVVVKLDNANLATPVTYTTLQTGAGILATDPDSLKSTPTGGLILTGEGDGALTFITNPGLASQTATSVKLNGTFTGAPDDSVIATATSGTFYVASTSGNTIYAINASGLTPGSLFVSVGDQFGSVDPNTGLVTPILSGLPGLHGADFVATPEPASVGMALAGLGVLAINIYRRRRTS